jgi:hypothetical protein
MLSYLCNQLVTSLFSPGVMYEGRATKDTAVS